VAVAVKVLLIWSCATVRLPGTVTLPLLLPSDTTDPPAGAAEVRVTVQVEVPGALTVAGEQPSELIETLAAVRFSIVD
jgi:hypothetical protein